MLQFPYSAYPESSPVAQSAAVRTGGAGEEDSSLRQERLLDEGLMETFPASDPVAVVRLT